MLKNVKRWLRGGGDAGSSPPKITQHPQSIYDAVPGSTVTLTVMVGPKESSLTLQFEWQYCSSSHASRGHGTLEPWSNLKPREQERVSGLDSLTLLITELKPEDAGKYRCLVINTAGVAQSKAATLTVVLPPEIESHPEDVKDAITGTEAVFSASVTEASANGAVVGTHVGVAGKPEVLQYSWEVLKANSGVRCAAIRSGSFIPPSSPASPSFPTEFPETPHQKIFREHHPDLRHYLNASSILPYLSKHSLVTADQLEELTLPVHTNTRKVDLLLNWLPRSTVDFLEKFIVCLREADDHLAHAELADQLQEALTKEKQRARTESEPQALESSLVSSPTLSCSSPFFSSTEEEGGGWELVREEEGRIEGTAGSTLRILYVEKCCEGQYRCRVGYKGCTVFSRPASLTVLEDDEIVRRLLQECLAAKETDRDAVIGEFLGKHGNSGRLAKKALIATLQCDSEHHALVQSFTSRQVPVNFMQDDMTPLHWACVKSHWRIVQHLLQHGANKSAQTKEGRTALHLVCERGDNNSLQFIILSDSETLINVQDQQGKTALHLACESAQKITPSKVVSQDMRDIKTVIQNLLKLKTSVTLTDENGQTPLHKAAIAGHHWIVEVMLLCNAACIDYQDKHQNTALHLASSLGWAEVVISMLERGANETIENEDHLTPIALAAVKGHTTVVDTLLRKPGTVQRDRKQTVYVTARMPRARSVNLEDDSNAGCYKEVKLLKTASEDHDVKRRSSEDVSSSKRSPGLKRLSALLTRSDSGSQPPQETILSGYVQKMDGKKWLRLWCQLQADYTLHLYKSQENSQRIATLPLPGYKVEPVPTSLSITLVHPRGKTKHNTILKLESEPEFTQWVQTLEKAVTMDFAHLNIMLPLLETSGSVPSVSRHLST